MLAPRIALAAAALGIACSPPAVTGGAPHATTAVAPRNSPDRGAIQEPLERLERDLRARIAQEDDGEVAVALIDLHTGRRLGINEKLSMHAASTMKVPVMMELFRQADEGRYSVDDSIIVVNEFSSIADGSRYRLDSDRDRELVARLGQPMPRRRIARSMITISSNLATNILIEHVGAASVQRMLATIGAQDMVVLRGVSDTPAFQRGMNNVTTAAALARVLEAVARCEIHTRASCDGMLELLEAQEFRSEIPAGLPPGTRVANKTGSITGIRHDAAIVMPPGRAPYVLVVLTRNVTGPRAATQVAVDVSRRVWEELVAAAPGD